VEVVGETVAGPGVWLDDGRAWTGEAMGSAREMLGTAWTGSWYVTLTLVLLALAAAIVIAQWPRATLGAPAAPLALAVAALLTVPIAAEWPYLLAVAFDVAAGSVLAAVGAAQPQPVRAIGLALAGTVLVAVGVTWSLAAQTATLLALGLALAGALAAFAADRRPDRPAAVAACGVLVVAETYVVLRVLDAPADRAGFGAVVVAGVVAVCARLLGRPVERLAAEAAAVLAGVAAFVPVLGDPGWTSHALLAGGLAAAVVAIRADRHVVGWASGVLLTLSSWVRLLMEDVTAPEAYTSGPALALIAVGYLRRRREPGLSSWRAYAAGLTLGLVPSLLAATDDAGLLRPTLLGLAAFAVVLLGARWRLQAPLLIGSVVLGVDVVIQIRPYAAALPNWVIIGAAGLMLLVLGATYERRLRDLRNLQERLRAFA